MNIRKIPAALLASVLAVSLLAGCSAVSVSSSQNEDVTGANALLSADETYEKSSTGRSLISDDASLYNRQAEIPVLYLAVGGGNESDGTNYSWTEVNSCSLTAQGDQPYKCESLLQVGDETAPVSGEFGFGELTANSTVRLYGETASTRQQKSYRVDIKDGKGSLDGMKTLILAKYFTDPLRVTNKLCLDLMQQSDALLSARSELVHLYVKDVSDKDDTLYEDYGMYTMLEPVNSKYLKARGIDTGSQLYKAVDFDFSRREDVLLNSTDANFSLTAFETVLEIKGDMDNSTLISMLDAVNSENTPIEDVIEKYFDSDNLYSFLAFEILTANRDMETSGYDLLCPTGTTKFYLIAWDNSGALRDDYSLLKDPAYSCGWSSGVHIFANNVLVKRILNSQACSERLQEAVDDMFTNVLNEKNVRQEANSLKNLSEDLLYSLPDRNFARTTQAEYEQLFANLYGQIENNYYAFYDSLKTPSPFSVYDPVQTDSALTFTWQASECLGQTVTYRIEVDDSWDFATPLAQAGGLSDTEWSMDPLAKGEYFVKITAVASNGNTQISYEHYPTETKETMQGVLCFYIQSDGSAAASRFDQES